MVYERGDSGYEQARLAAVWNERKPDRHPAAILVAADEDDVVRAVGLARERGWTIGIRSGGHSWVGNGVRDGGLLLDLSRLDTVTVDAGAGVAAVGPAAKGPALNEALLPHGLFFPTGHAPTVGIGGFILGGGYGWNSRALGPACLSIRAIDVVLPDGRLVHADDDQLETLSPAVEISAKVGLADKTASLTATAFCTAETGEDLLAPLEKIPFRDRAVRSTVNRETTIAELYELADRLNPPGLRWAVDGIWAGGDPEAILDAAEPMLTGIPGGNAFVLWMLWGGFPARADACWSTQAKVYLSPNAGWPDAGDDLDREQWVHGSLASIQHLSQGLQFSDNNLADRPDNGLSPENAARLERIRKVYDPEGLLSSYMAPEQSTTAYGISARAS
jgi:FAD/FMN-containing dehydrogenase